LTRIEGAARVLRDNAKGDEAVAENSPQTVVDVVAKVLYASAVSQAETEAAVSIAAAPLEKIRATLEEVRTGTDDRLASILIFALIDDVMLCLLKANMNSKMKGGLPRVFEGQGMLATASSRLTLADALGWIDAETLADADLLRKIRNHFAHNVSTRSFSDSPVSGWLTSMKPRERRYLEVVGAVAPGESHRFKESSDLNLRHRFVIRSADVVSQMCLELATFPSALRHRVDPKHMFSDWDKMPSSLQEARRIVVSCILSSFSHT
jgi:DNA-binding MltR family transcriptional regulator